MLRVVVALSIPITLLLGSPAWASRGIPEVQNRPPAGVDLPYRPGCHQLKPGPSGVPGWEAWGPVIDGVHQNWYGLQVHLHPVEKLKLLEAAGLCVRKGVTVPWQPLETVPSPSEDALEEISPLERNHALLTGAIDGTQPKDEGGLFWVLVALVLGGSGLSQVIDFDNLKLGRKPKQEQDSTAGNPDDALGKVYPPLVEVPQGTALDRLIASPFVSRAIFGFQRTGKTNLCATASRHLASQGTKVFHLNLASYGDEDDGYWQHAKSVRADLSTLANPDRVISAAIALVNEFYATDNALLVVDEWGYLCSKTNAHADAIAPLVALLADKIATLSSTGMKRRKAVWAISPEIVASAMVPDGLSIKKLQLCLVAIAPGHTAEWGGQRLDFSWELFSQVKANFPAVTTPPVSTNSDRIAFVAGEWVPLGTEVAAPVAISVPRGSSTVCTPVALPDPVDSIPGLKTFVNWLQKHRGNTISFESFKNANCFREITRSRDTFESLCDKAILKGLLVPKENGYYVLP